MIRTYNIDSFLKKNVLILTGLLMIWVSIPYGSCLLFTSYHSIDSKNRIDKQIWKQFVVPDIQATKNLAGLSRYGCPLMLGNLDLVLKKVSKSVVSPTRMVTLFVIGILPVSYVGTAEIKAQDLQFSTPTSLFDQKASLLIYH